MLRPTNTTSMLPAPPLSAEPAANSTRPATAMVAGRSRDEKGPSRRATTVTTTAYTVITQEAWTTVVSSWP